MNILRELELKRPSSVMGMTQEDGMGIFKFIQDHEIKSIVETGVCYGFSSVYFLEAMVDGILVSIDPLLMPLNKLHIKPCHYPRWIPIQNYSTHCLDRVLKAFSPNMFVHDSKHDYETMMFEYMTACNNGVKYIASDDVGGPYCGSVWKDFLKQSKYEEVYIGKRARIALIGV